MVYAGFLRRSAGVLLDFILIGIPTIFAYRFALRSPELIFYSWRIGGSSILLIVNLYLLVRFGGTPGKLLMGIRVVQVNGSSLTWRNALFRESVYVLNTIYGIIIFLSIYSNIDHELVRSMPWSDLGAFWRQVYPPWVYTVENLCTIYFLSEVIVMLTNKKRRAIHDFLGGTVVVVKSKMASMIPSEV